MLVYEPFAPYLKAYTADTPPEEVLAALPFLDIESGAWVAGGFVRRIIANIPWSKGDVDMYISKQGPTVRQDHTRLYEAMWTRTPSETNAITFQATLESNKNKRVCLQQFYNSYSLTALFRTYDFSCCCVATDGITLAYERGALTDIRLKRLRIPRSICTGAPWTSGRVKKFINEGYKISGRYRENLQWLADFNPKIDLTENRVEYGMEYPRTYEYWFYRQNRMAKS